MLFITGLRSSELRFITVDKVKNLFNHGTILVDRNKRDMKKKPTTLTVQGRKVLAMNAKTDDFEFMFKHKSNDDSYFFTSIGRNNPLSR